MAATFAFLDALGLDQEARERDIRSAYARRLKTIDQEHDAQGFQDLRAVYEEALAWAAWKKREAGAPPEAATAMTPPAAADTVPETPGAPEPVDAVDPRALGEAAFGRLATEMEDLLAQPAQNNPDPYEALLRRRLDDDDLINIDARIVFEAIVATVLAHGWRPGHENLFEAALTVFGWDADPQRLLVFGHAGLVLDRALAERRLFATQPPARQAAMRRAARALRDAGAPTVQRLRNDMRIVETMVARFPHMMRILVSFDDVEQWRSAYQAHFGAQPGAAFDIDDEIAVQVEPRSLATRLWVIARNVALTIVTALLLYAVFKPTDPAPATPAVSQQVLDAHVPPLRYQPSPGTKPGVLDTRVRVFLDADRRVSQTRNVSTSGEPGFDEAVAEALRNATPFPPKTPAEFEVSYTATITAQQAANANAPAPQQATDGTTPGAKLLGQHIPPVDYQPTRFAQPGKLALHYRVYLDADGMIVRFKQIKGSGEPRLDHAFEHALRAAKPFPASTARSFDVEWSTTITQTRRTKADRTQQPPREA
ncbi:TonB C-terminal domain-containing protein [Oxalobacteraceae sp. CFBP 13730]|nr:TonB C-terminal domain-containing protein [Oxalobacteraceae sp. CFBP 13730]